MQALMLPKPKAKHGRPTKPKTKPPPKSKVEFKAAINQFQEYKVHLGEDTAAIGVPIGHLLHWPALMTRPIVPSDVDGKTTSMAAVHGWLWAYSCTAHVLSTSDRAELERVLDCFDGINGLDSEDLAGAALQTWYHSQLQNKVYMRARTREHCHTH
jgi:hypothetical protein